MMTLNIKPEDGCALIAPSVSSGILAGLKGNYFLKKLMESYIEKKTRNGRNPGNGRATFRYMVKKYGDRHFKRLYVFGTNLTQRAVQKFHKVTTPDLAIAEAGAHVHVDTLLLRGAVLPNFFQLVQASF
jgi:hypothetical protein